MPADVRGEFERIRAILGGLPPGEDVVVGPGDDAAVLRPRDGFDLVVTTDAFVEGRHWRAGLLPAEGVGRRLAAANLSDLAAMGARPRWAVIACGAPASASETFLRAIEHACAAALASEGAAIVGGNLSATDGAAWFAVTLVGEVERGAALTRAGAREGDVLAVTGYPGRSAALLRLALAPAAPTLEPIAPTLEPIAPTLEPIALAAVPAELAAWYAAPPCRVRAARSLAATGGVHAAIDLSDGLAGDLAHLALASGVGAVLDAACWPGDAALLAAADVLARRDPGVAAAEIASRLPLGPSDDYELLLAIAPERLAACRAAAAAAGTPLTAVGTVVAGSRGLVLRDASGREAPLAARGYDHFA
jgi:thiamine-monophosphate kinase